MPENLMQFAPILVMVVAFYFFIMRPQQKKVQAQRDMHAALQPGDEVITSGGLIGTVVELKDQRELLIETGAANMVRILKAAITERTPKTEVPKVKAPKIKATGNSGRKKSAKK